MERKTYTGMGALAVSSLILGGCNFSEATPNLSSSLTNGESNHSFVVPYGTPSESPAVQIVGFDIQAMQREIRDRHNINVRISSGFSTNVRQEMQIISRTLDKIPGSGYLINVGIGIQKNTVPERTSPVKGLALTDDNRGEFYLFISSNFDPKSADNVEKSEVYKTHEEALEWTIAHETGHLFSTRVSSKEDRTNNGEDPLYSTFSTLDNWKFGLVGDRVAPELKDTPFWYSDFGKAKRPFVAWFNTVNIEETFADYFAASLLHPELMSDQERKYFENIHNGLRYNPQSFVDEIKRDPQILLR